MSESNRNKPIGLAVTLVILVICLMLNIVFISKNISYKQDNQVRTGKQIVYLLEQINAQSNYINEQFLQDREIFIATEDEVHRTLNTLIKTELVQLEQLIAELFQVIASIDASRLSASALHGELPKLTMLINQLETDNYIANEQLSIQLVTFLNEVKSSVNLFNFKLDGIKTAMIRMSNGFEWVEAIEALDNTVSID